MDYSRQQGKVGALGGEDNQTRGGELEWITSTVPSKWLTDSWTHPFLLLWGKRSWVKRTDILAN